MVERGQLALDLLLGLVVLLLVVSALAPVLTRFEEVQQEVSIRSQLRETSVLAELLTAYSASHIHLKKPYPGSSPALPNNTNFFARSEGFINLEGLRSVGHSTNLSCVSQLLMDANGVEILLTVPSSVSGLPYEVDVNRYILTPDGYSTYHTVFLDDCQVSARVVGLP